MNNQKVIIIGAGLSGLMLYVLKQKGIHALVLEAIVALWTHRNYNR
jgi:cation diffusion facilitator CzcD-associated flavoprotein CzcO